MLAPLTAATPTPDNAQVDDPQDPNAIDPEFKQIEETEQSSERQEPKTPRKPERSSTIETLVTMGLYAALITRIAFTCVYGLVSPVFRSEAVVQLAPPSDLKTADVQQWLARQAKDAGSDLEVLQNAWKQMQRLGYSRHHSGKEWLASLPHEMEVKVDTASKTMAVRMLGDSPEGLGLAANSVAAAYADKAERLNRDSPQSGQTRTAVLAVPATPAIAVNDYRTSLAVSLSATVLLLGLLVMRLVRRAMMRDLRDIDETADPSEDVATGS